MKSRVMFRPRPVGRRFSSSNTQAASNLRMPFPSAVKLEMVGAGGGGGSWDDFYSSSGGGGTRSSGVSLSIYSLHNPIVSIGDDSAHGAIPATAGPSDAGDTGDSTFFNGIEAAGGVGGFGGATSGHSTTPNGGSLIYHDDAGIRFWPYGDTSASVDVDGGSGICGFGGYGLTPSDGGSTNALYRSVNCKGGSGRMDITVL